MASIARRARVVPFLLLTPAVLQSGAAWTQVERSGGTANTQLYQDYQQAVAERARLKADSDKLKGELDRVKQQVATLKQQLAAAQAGAATSQATANAAENSRATTAKNLETLRGDAQQLVERFRQTIATLKGVELDRSQLQHDLAQSRAEFDRCALANYDLYQVDNEVLGRYAHQGAFTYMARAEPFTRIERTRIDNAVLEYRQRAQALRVQPHGGAVGPGAAKGAAAPASSSPSTSTPPATGSAAPTHAPASGSGSAQTEPPRGSAAQPEGAGQNQ